VQDDEDDRDNDQCMDPTAGARQPRTYVPAEKSKQPQNYKNYDDSPQHEISPLNDPLEATWLVDRAADSPTAESTGSIWRPGLTIGAIGLIK
jgi:hypothetical protein